jgi:hypothetical protein
MAASLDMSGWRKKLEALLRRCWPGSAVWSPAPSQGEHAGRLPRGAGLLRPVRVFHRLTIHRQRHYTINLAGL